MGLTSLVKEYKPARRIYRAETKAVSYQLSSRCRTAIKGMASKVLLSPAEFVEALSRLETAEAMGLLDAVREQAEADHPEEMQRCRSAFAGWGPLRPLPRAALRRR